MAVEIIATARARDLRARVESSATRVRAARAPARGHVAVSFEFHGSHRRAISRCPIAGCGLEPAATLQAGDISPYAIALNAERLYYTNVEHGTVVSIRK